MSRDLKISQFCGVNFSLLMELAIGAILLGSSVIIQEVRKTFVISQMQPCQT